MTAPNVEQNGRSEPDDVQLAGKPEVRLLSVLYKKEPSCITDRG